MVPYAAKKVIRVGVNGVKIGRDLAVNQMLMHTNLYALNSIGITIYNVLTANPYEIAFSILAVKLGITNKILIGVILAFLL
jgi:hypothetical protein